MRSNIWMVVVAVAIASMATQHRAHAVVIDVSNVTFASLSPNPIPAGKRVTSFSYEYDYNKESNASVSASFALSITLSTDTVLGGGDDYALGTLNTATSSVGGISGHFSATTSNLNGISALLIPPATPPGVYNAFLQIAPRSPHADPDSIDAIGQLPGTVTVIAAPNPQGDYNYNGVVDAVDYVLWRNFVGQTGMGMSTDGNGDNVVDSGDFDTWRSHFGETSGGAAMASRNTAVPEPAAAIMLVFTAGWACLQRHKIT